MQDSNPAEKMSIDARKIPDRIFNADLSCPPRTALGLMPAETAAPCPAFKVVFGDTQVNLGVRPPSSFGRHLVSLKRKAEFLLIHSGRRQQRRFHAAAEPGRHGPFHPAEGGYRLAPMGFSSRRTIAQGKDANQLFAGLDYALRFPAAICQPYPAGIQSQLLSGQRDAFAIVADALFEPGLPAHQADVMMDVMKLTVPGQQTLKSFRVAENHLDMQRALLVAGINLGLQAFRRFRTDDLMGIVAHAVAAFDGLKDIHFP